MARRKSGGGGYGVGSGKRVSKAYGTKRPAGYTQQGPRRGAAARNQVTGVISRGKTAVRTMSSQAANFVGRPGFKGVVPGPVDGKLPVRRLFVTDFKKGIQTPAATLITKAHVDLVGNLRPRIAAVLKAAPPNRGKTVIRTPRKTRPVFANRPGNVQRPGGGQVTKR